MRRVVWILVVGVLLSGCGAGGESTAGGNPVLDGTGEVAAGEALYQANCAVCHGADADGTEIGPSFLNDVYVPSHHADGAFLLAVRNGVQQHHWDFGPMPPIAGLDDSDVADIVAYVRTVQRDAGIID